MTDMMPPYPIMCTHRACRQLAAFKIAAQWSDGTTQELKTYALTCKDCLLAAYHLACEKQSACRTGRDEHLEKPRIFHLERGRRDRQLVQAVEIEQQILADSTPS